MGNMGNTVMVIVITHGEHGDGHCNNTWGTR